MGEYGYGNPDIADEWTYLRRHSTYHLLRHDILGMPEEESPARAFVCCVLCLRRLRAKKGLGRGLRCADVREGGFALFNSHLPKTIGLLLGCRRRQRNGPMLRGKEGGISLKVCKSCMQAKYCNAECQRNHLATHKKVCKQ